MNKIDLFYGFLIGLATTILGCTLYISIFTDYAFFDIFIILKKENLLGKIITLGTILNIVPFFYLLNRKKELMARGVILAIIVLAISTMFV